MAAGRYLKPLWTAAPFQGLLDRLIQRLPLGPDEATLADGQTHVWGEVRDATGQSVVARLHGPEAYRFTALTALAVIEQILAGKAPIGFQTPARAYGADFVLSIAGVRREDCEQ